MPAPPTLPAPVEGSLAPDVPSSLPAEDAALRLPPAQSVVPSAADQVGSAGSRGGEMGCPEMGIGIEMPPANLGSEFVEESILEQSEELELVRLRQGLLEQTLRARILHVFWHFLVHYSSRPPNPTPLFSLSLLFHSFTRFTY